MKQKTRWTMNLWALSLVAIATASGMWVGGCNSDATNVVLTPSGGTVRSKDQKVTLEFPSGAVSESVGITVEAISNPSTDSNVISGTIYEFGPEGIVFNKAVKLTIVYDASQVADALEETLRLHLWTNGAWKEISSDVNMSTHTVAGMIHTLGTYALKPKGSNSPTNDAGVDGNGDVVLNEDGSDYNDGYDPPEDMNIDAVTTNGDMGVDLSETDGPSGTDGGIKTDGGDAYVPSFYQHQRIDLPENVRFAFDGMRVAVKKDKNYSVYEKIGGTWVEQSVFPVETSFNGKTLISFSRPLFAGTSLVILDAHAVLVYQQQPDQSWKLQPHLSSLIDVGKAVQGDSETSFENQVLFLVSKETDKVDDPEQLVVLSIGATSSTITLGPTHIDIPQTGQKSYGSQNALSATTLAVAQPYNPASPNPGVYVFERNGTDWNFSTKLTPMSQVSPLKSHEDFAHGIATQGNRIILGESSDLYGNGNGKAYVFNRDISGTWKLEATLDPGCTRSECYIAINGNRIAIGATQDFASKKGIVYVYKFDGTKWLLEAQLLPSDGQAYDNFGQYLKFYGNTIAVGGKGTTAPASIYFFDLPPL